ncbi:MAG: aquaporin family protein [Candidatus Marinimicrobia bacterium]|nr:aquaporin family protein [Candidatus Neomarinimicrobiota bacterium]|tara:strand:- start:3277 stop:3921 length:645 start_codon:yes stop_codon:yes gene_type:complete
MNKYIAEFIGTYFLVATVIGSGIMADNLSNGNNAVALLGNTLATGAILYVLITIFGPLSGAHFNPIVSLVFYLRNEIQLKIFVFFSILQVLGGLFGTFLTHYIFEIDIIQVSTNIRGELPLLISEMIATFGLIITILLTLRSKGNVAIAVALFITAGYWFTSSTSFANPAVTIARIFTDTFTGISPKSIPFFILGQTIGAYLAYIFDKFLNESI